MKLRITSFLVFLFLVATPVIASNSLLPCQGLEQRIDFWKKVYTHYGADDLIIHDRIHVNLIYGIAARSNLSEKITEIQNALREIQSNLKTPVNLNPVAAQIHKALIAQNLTVSSDLVDNLIDRIHIQMGVKERFRSGVIRSGRYVEKFRAIMKEHNVPTELALLPLVESSFINANSKAGAVGVWQFMKGTGRLYMNINGNVDERLDPIRSTDAAAHFLRGNYEMLGAWPLSITAYNHGRGGAVQAQKLHGSDLPTIIAEYRGRYFGYASMNFYCEFLAALDVYENYPQHFGELALDKPDPAPSEEPTLKASNTIAAPKKSSTENSIGSAPLVVASKYRVRHGDTLSEIADRFGMSLRHLMDINNLQRRIIYAGQVLRVKKSLNRHNVHNLPSA
jgi:membrane-bound lytic murein transglycosylase D